MLGRLVFLLSLLLVSSAAQARPLTEANWLRHLDHRFCDYRLHSGKLVVLTSGSLIQVDPISGVRTGRLPLRHDFRDGDLLQLEGGDYLIKSRWAVGVVDPTTFKVRWEAPIARSHFTGKRLFAVAQQGLAELDLASGQPRLLKEGKFSQMEPCGSGFVVQQGEHLRAYSSEAQELATIGNVTSNYDGGNGDYALVWKAGWLTAVSTQTGKAAWEKPWNRMGTIWCDARVAYVYHDLDLLSAVDLASGKVGWTRHCSQRFPIQQGFLLQTDKGWLVIGHDGKVLDKLPERPTSYSPTAMWGSSGTFFVNGKALRKLGGTRFESSILAPLKVGDLWILASELELVAVGPKPVAQGRVESERQSVVYSTLSHLQTPGPAQGSVSVQNGQNLSVTLDGQKVFESQGDPWRTYQSFPLQLNLSQPGQHTLTLKSGASHVNEVIQVSRYGIVAKKSGDRLGICIQDCVNAKAGSHLNVAALDRKGQVLAQGRSDAQGLLTLAAPGAARVRVGAPGEGCQLDLPESAASDRHQVYLRSERPLYRPGQEIFFHGVVMDDEQGKLRLAEGKKVQVEVRDSQDNVIYQKSLTSQAKGVFSGQLKLSQEPPLGRYRMTARAENDSQGNQLPFEVQEYRKPPFEITVTPPQPLTLAGQNLTYQVSCKYFFGGPVGAAKLRYTLTAQPLYGEPDPPEDQETIGDSGYRYWNYALAEGEAICDGNGQARIQLSSDKIHEDVRCTLSVTALGEEGQEVVGSSSSLVSAARFGLYVAPLEWLNEQGRPALLRIRTVDRLGRPHSAWVHLAIRAYGSNRDLVRIRVRSDAQGNAHYAWKNPPAGYFSVSAASSDEGGRKVSGHGYLWVAGSGTFNYNYPSLELLPQRRKLKAGQRLKVLVLSSRPGALLLSVEGDRLHSQRRIELKSRSTVIELPVLPEYAPGFTLKGTLLAGGELSSSDANLRVPDESRRIKITVSRDKVDYRPGSAAQLEIRTTNQGKPVPTSLTVAVVDEALHALKADFAPDIFSFFYGNRPNRVETATMWPRKPRAAGFQTIAEPAPVRSIFKDTAWWQSHILTDEEGVARISVPLPDNLTRWRATLQAAGGDAQVGQTTTSFVTQLPVMIRWVTPRFLVEGDQARLANVVTSRTREDQKIEVRLSSSNGALAPRELALAAGQSVRCENDFQAPPASGSPLELTSRVQGSQGSDAERIQLPLLAFGNKRHHAVSGLTQQEVQGEFHIPADARQARLQVRLAQGPRGVVGGALRYLADFPYGCVEQTMSRFLPTVVAIRSSQELGSQLDAPVERMVRAGLDKLYGYQHSDGGWGWWKEDSTHPFMTGYVLYGLALTRAAGYEVSEEVFQRAIGSAKAQLASPSQDIDTRVYLGWALAQAGAPVDLAPLASDSERAGIYTQALYWQALKKLQPDSPELSVRLQRLRDQVLRESVSEAAPGSPLQLNLAVPQAHWQARSLTPHGFTSDDMEATCLVLECLAQQDPNDPLVIPGINWIMSQRRGERWKSTKDTTRAVLTLTSICPAAAPAASSPLVKVDGQEIALTAQGAEWNARLDLNAGQQGKLQLVPAGLTPVAIGLSYISSSKGTSLAPEEHGIQVKRSYSKTTLAAQERLQVTIELDCGDQTYSYVKVEDPRPAGCEVVSEDDGYHFSRREDRDDRSVFFFTTIHGKMKFSYLLRGETPGRYRALPSHAELMYKPDVWGTSESHEINIR